MEEEEEEPTCSSKSAKCMVYTSTSLWHVFLNIMQLEAKT